MGIPNTAVGMRVYIGPIHTDATDTLAEFVALSYSEIGKIRTIGRFGDKAALVTYRTLADRREHKLKGIRNAGAITLGCARDPFDVGQIAVVAAADLDFRYAIKIEGVDKKDANDTVTFYYFGAFVMQNEEDWGDGSNVGGSDFLFEIDTDIFRTPAAVVA